MATTESTVVEAQSLEADAAVATTKSPSTKRKAAVDEIEVDLQLPEPPSKRARRALKKGKPLPSKPDSDDEKREKKKEDKENKETPRSEHSVWIGNLAFSINPTQLRKWLVDNSGEVITDESITRVKMPTTKQAAREKKDRNDKAENKGFAYVDFADIGGKVAAIALSETDFAGRRLLIKDATSFEGRPKKEKEDTAGAADGTSGKTQDGQATKDVNASRKVFVGNMSFKTTEDDVRRNFEKCGEIDWVKVATFEDTGKCKGYGWVKFREAEAAAWAVKGFVKLKEEIETEDDFKDDNADEEDGDEDAKEENGKPKEKQYKTRKWWVNRMLGRELKLELAEDDQLRYKKRFGKDAPKKLEERDKKRREAQEAAGARTKRREEKAGPQSSAGFVKSGKGKDSDLMLARLTGTTVQSTGTKMTFD